MRRVSSEALPKQETLCEQLFLKNCEITCGEWGEMFSQSRWNRCAAEVALSLRCRSILASHGIQTPMNHLSRMGCVSTILQNLRANQMSWSLIMYVSCSPAGQLCQGPKISWRKLLWGDSKLVEG